ncbi:MAG: DUF2079 domain-containing protein [Bacteroidia bacterium]|nr:DUF2079 domain-containing protein [Bacteroidia bacterium]
MMNKDLTFQFYTAKQKAIIYSIFGVFTLVFCSISLVNHYLFRTYAYDLGIYNNMLYSYSHFSWNYTPIQQPAIANAFADHLEPVFILFAPLYWIFGSYTLLLIQIALLVFGGVGILHFSRLYSKNNTISIFALVQFFGMWGVYSALAFDFHNNVTAAMLVPWILLFALQKNIKPLLACWAMVLLSKENMALYGIFICLGLVIHFYNDRQLRKLFFILFLVSGAYFVFVVKIFIPLFQDPGMTYLYKGMYKALGETPKDFVLNLINRPEYIFSLLFENYSNEQIYNGIKSELHFSVLLSGGVFLFFKPQFLVMLIPIFAQKLFNSDAARWGINYHYSIEFVPVLVIASITFISDWNKTEKFKVRAAACVALVTFIYTIKKIDRRVSIWYDKTNTAFFLQRHYKQENHIKIIRNEMKKLPINNTDAISAQDNLVPHLANRKYIYMYPYTDLAEYIILAPKTSLYPLKDSAYNSNLDTLKQSVYWQNITPTNQEVFVFKRK